jgi:hypothetical protein
MRADWMCLLLGFSMVCCAAADEALSSDFLEFLGNGSQVDGQWIDPMSLHESPETFASVVPADESTKQRSHPSQPPDVSPSKGTPPPPHNDDEGDEND